MGSLTPSLIHGFSQRLLQTLNDESLQIQEGEYYSLFADLYLSVGAKEDARDMAWRALESRVFYNGADSERAKKARDLMKRVGAS